MTWTPPHNNFTTFVKDDNNIYIKCADGSWVVLTLSPNPVGPYGEGVGGSDGFKKKNRYHYLEETWNIIGKRAIPDEFSSKIIAYGRTEATVFGIKLLGEKLEEVRNVFELSGIISDGINQILEIYGTQSEYLDSEFYTFGKKAERTLHNTPIIGSKRDYVELEYVFDGVMSQEDIFNRLVQGCKRNENNKIIFASGRTSVPMTLTTPIEGSKTEQETKAVNIVGKKDFNKLLKILLMEV